MKRTKPTITFEFLQTLMQADSQEKIVEALRSYNVDLDQSASAEGEKDAKAIEHTARELKSEFDREGKTNIKKWHTKRDQEDFKKIRDRLDRALDRKGFFEGLSAQDKEKVAVTRQILTNAIGAFKKEGRELKEGYTGVDPFKKPLIQKYFGDKEITHQDILDMINFIVRKMRNGRKR